MSDLVSSVPGVFSALLGLINTAAAAQTPPVQVFPFELTQYEPGAYIMVSGVKDVRYEWESIGSFSQREMYSIYGKATVFTGASLADDVSVSTTILAQTFALFQSCVMTPAMSNRNMPILGTTGPTPFLMLPELSDYTGMPGSIGGGQGGWAGVIDWSFSFAAVLTPQ